MMLTLRSGSLSVSIFASLLVTLLFTVSQVAAHGKIISPPARTVGIRMMQVCGAPAVNAFRQDDTAPLENIPLTQATSQCNVFVCGGTQLEDNLDRIQRFRPGQLIRVRAALPIPHAGPMNVSIINPIMNRPLYTPLIEDMNYADEFARPLPANNTLFSVRIPNDPTLSQSCARPGMCTLQWFWFGTRAKQSYENCIDFVV